MKASNYVAFEAIINDHLAGTITFADITDYFTRFSQADIQESLMRLYKCIKERIGTEQDKAVARNLVSMLGLVIEAANELGD